LIRTFIEPCMKLLRTTFLQSIGWQTRFDYVLFLPVSTSATISFPQFRTATHVPMLWSTIGLVCGRRDRWYFGRANTHHRILKETSVQQGEWIYWDVGLLSLFYLFYNLTHRPTYLSHNTTQDQPTSLKVLSHRIRHGQVCRHIPWRDMLRSESCHATPDLVWKNLNIITTKAEIWCRQTKYVEL